MQTQEEQAQQGAVSADAPLKKEDIIAAFEQERLHVEIMENKNGQIVVSRMCELYKNQVFDHDVEWDEHVERALKDKVTLFVKPELRRMIVQEQRTGKAIKPILTLAGPLPKRNSFTFDLVFLFRPEQSDRQVLEDTLDLLHKLESRLAAVRPA